MSEQTEQPNAEDVKISLPVVQKVIDALVLEIATQIVAVSLEKGCPSVEQAEELAQEIFSKVRDHWKKEFGLKEATDEKAKLFVADFSL